MAQSPQWKVYRNKQYVAACKHPEDAAVLVAASCGGQVKYGHTLIVWNESFEAFPAGESYDGAAQVMLGRVRQAHAASLKRNGWSDEKIAAFMRGEVSP